jgi:nucleotide-binding universal stress UspA family protein
MTMFNNTLVGVDGRAGGRDGIALASRLTSPDGTLTLAHIHPGHLRPSHAISAELIRQEGQAATTLLESERDSAGVQAQLISIQALSPGRGLHEQAESQGADLLVVGSCRHGALGRAMLGDDTRDALNGAPCAVAIAPVSYAEHPAPPARIGIAYNGSPESQRALTIARELSVQTGASLHALEVVSIPTVAYTGLVAPALGASIDLMLEEANARMQKLSDVEGRAAYGLAGEELAAFGDEVDLLILGSRSYGPLKRLVLGSTSDYLQRHSRCALLVLPGQPPSITTRTASARPARPWAPADAHPRACAGVPWTPAN